MKNKWIKDRIKDLEIFFGLKKFCQDYYDGMSYCLDNYEQCVFCKSVQNPDKKKIRELKNKVAKMRKKHE